MRLSIELRGDALGAQKRRARHDVQGERGKTTFIQRYKQYITIVILIAILSNAGYYAFTHYEGATLYGDDAVYASLAWAVLQGTFRTNSFIFSTRLMQVYPIAFFYSMMGVTLLSSSMWQIISYLGIIIVAFLVVRLLYDDKAALITAFLVSMFPLVTKFSVTMGEDIPLTFISSLAFLLFLYAQRNNRWHYFFASGALLASTWLIGVEGAVIMEFFVLYIIIELARKKLHVDRTTLFFVYGFVVVFAVAFLFSYLNSGNTFNVITTNLCFYSKVAGTACGHSTIPSTNSKLSFYIGSMFQYNIVWNLLAHDPVKYVWNYLLASQPSDFGLYAYFVVLFGIALAAMRDRRAYLFLFWFLAIFVLLEFGPMHVGINTQTHNIVYILAYRLNRFLLPLSIPISAIIGIGLSRMIEFKDRRLYVSIPLTVVAAIVLAIIVVSSFNITEFWYYWQAYPESLVMPAVSYVKNVAPPGSGTHIYVEGLFNDGSNIAYIGSMFGIYYGNPSSQYITNVESDVSCGSLQNDSYIVWSGAPSCRNWENVYNVTRTKYIPDYVINAEQGALPDKPTNVYYVEG